VKTTFLGLIEL